MKVRVRLKERRAIYQQRCKSFDVAWIIGFVRGANDVPLAVIVTEHGEVELCDPWVLDADMEDFLKDIK